MVEHRQPSKKKRMVKMKKVLTVAIVLFVLAGLLVGCATTPPPTSEQISVSVVATRDFGAEFIFDKTATVMAETTAEKALGQVAELRKSGSYVLGIDGLYGSTTEYWFYYINGILANVFASGYELHDGDMQHWDFHDFSYSMHGSSAIIGDFPEPFLHGYAGKVYPTLIAYTGNLGGEAERLEGRLEELGVSQVSIKSATELSSEEKEHSNLILVCTADFELVAELDEVYDRLGFFAHFDNGQLEVLNDKGKVVEAYGAGSGVIQATQSLWNPKGSWACENVVWMVSGTDESGVKNAVGALLDRYSQIQHAFAVVVADGEIIKVPQ